MGSQYIKINKIFSQNLGNSQTNHEIGQNEIKFTIPGTKHVIIISIIIIIMLHFQPEFSTICQIQYASGPYNVLNSNSLFPKKCSIIGNFFAIHLGTQPL